MRFTTAISIIVGIFIITYIPYILLLNSNTNDEEFSLSKIRESYTWLYRLNVTKRKWRRFDSLIFKGQFGFQQQLDEIEPNASLDELWKAIEINRIAFMSKAISLGTYDSQLSVIHNSDVSLQPIPPQSIGFNRWLITIYTSYDNKTKSMVNTASQITEFFNVASLTQDYTSEYLEVISITELLQKQNNQITLQKLYKCLSTNGWCFVKYPDKDFNTIQSILGQVYQFMSDNMNDAWYYNKYYYEYSWYKKVLHVFTGDIFDLYQYKYPLPILKELKVLSNIVDKLSIDIINVLYRDLFGLGEMKDFMKYNITLMNDPYNIHGLNHKAGMLDFVLYSNNDDDDDSSKYNKVHIREHTDPGLFSLSFGSDNLGLQMFDIVRSKWINVPNNYGVLWCGEIASTITKHVIKPGIHRVIRNINNTKPRFTAWYEVCINNQVWPHRKFSWFFD